MVEQTITASSPVDADQNNVYLTSVNSDVFLRVFAN